MGDFNEVLTPSEVRGGNFCTNRASFFADLLKNCSMVDLGASGCKYTWHRNNKGVHTVSKRLDKVIAYCQWGTLFPYAFVENLCRLHSDHHPVLLRCGGMVTTKGIRPFRFEAAWSSHEGFRRLCMMLGTKLIIM